MYIAVNKRNIIVAVSETPLHYKDHEIHKIDNCNKADLIGTRHKIDLIKNKLDLKVAYICNWGDCCGISTYTKFLVDAMADKVKEIKIFSEKTLTNESNDERVDRCWERGKSLNELIKKIKDYSPDFLIIQHEFGIFPKATYFLQLMQGIENIPYVVAMHSVYEHLDKSVCTSAAKDIIVHSEEAKKALVRTGNSNNIYVVPHGCVQYDDKEVSELWNIFQTPYALMQFGFGFFYKGVDRAIDAVNYLKNKDEKFKDIFYVYLCSENNNTNMVHVKYYEHLLKKIEDYGLQDNVAIIKKFQSEKTINSYLRTAKIALFPYVINDDNKVYGASGAIRVAMANKIPVIASDAHLFDDLDGIVPRPGGYISLAKEIDEIFSNDGYRKDVLNKSANYIKDNSWEKSADKYLDVYYKLIS